MRRIGLAFAVAAIGFALVALAQASIGPGTRMVRASGAVFGALMPVW